MEVREIKEDELNELLNLYSHLHATDEPLPNVDVVNAIWHEIQTNPNIQYFGMFVDGRLISSCTICIIPNLTRGCRPYGVIENVVTHKDFRNKGYGTHILGHALGYAWGRNCYKVMLQTGRKDEATFQFYESAGFDRYEKRAFIARPQKTTSI
jgi:GNAT superfamily N-acetyltransferase